MGMPAAERRWTREEVLELIEQNPLSTPRYELVDGELFVTPSPTFVHQRAVGELYWLLVDYLRREPVAEALLSPSDVEPEPGVTVGPDVFVVPTAESTRLLKARTARALLLAVEVISPGSARGDRGRKRQLYQRTTPEYWIVDTNLRHIELWQPDFAEALILRDRLEWHPADAATTFVLDVPAYFAKVFRESV